MVHLVGPGRVDPAKLEVEDPLEEEYGSLHKRSKASMQFNQVFFTVLFLCNLKFFGLWEYCNKLK